MPAFLELAAELTLVALFLLCYLTLQGYRFSIGPLLDGVAWLLQKFAVSLPGIGTIGPGPWLAKQVKRINSLILSALAQGVHYSEVAIVGLWNGTAKLSDWIVGEVEALSRDTAGAFERTKTFSARKLKKYVAATIAAALALGLGKLHRLLNSTVHALRAVAATALHRVVAVEHELDHWVGRTAKQVRALLRRLARLGWLAGVASIAALGHLIFKKLHLGWLTRYRSLAAFGIAVLAKLGLNFLRCDNTKTAGRAVCGMDANLLSKLLLDTIILSGTVSLVEFVRDAQQIESLALDALRGFIREA